MKLRKINEKIDEKNDVREVEKDVMDNAALNWDQSEAITDYDKKKKEAKKELAVILDNAEDLVKKTAPEEEAPKNVVNEGKLVEAPKLEPNYDGRKSFYGKARYENENGSKVLYSYNTKVAEITPDHNVKLYPAWDYSQTTLRHVKEFLRQNGFEASSSKQMERDYVYPTSTLGESHEKNLREEGGDLPEEEAAKNLGFSGVINSLIIDEWEAVDGYNAAIASVEYEKGSPEILEILRDIVTEEMIHIGQLEKALTLVDQNADAIKDGEAEAAETIDDNGGDGKLELPEPEIADEELLQEKGKEGKAFIKTSNSPVSATELFDELEAESYQGVEYGDNGLYVNKEDYDDAMDILLVLEAEAEEEK